MTLYCDERSNKARAFLAAVAVVCQEYGFSLSHEDGHGGFLIVPLDPLIENWRAEAGEEVAE